MAPWLASPETVWREHGSARTSPDGATSRQMHHLRPSQRGVRLPPHEPRGVSQGQDPPQSARAPAHTVRAPNPREPSQSRCAPPRQHPRTQPVPGWAAGDQFNLSFGGRPLVIPRLRPGGRDRNVTVAAMQIADTKLRWHWSYMAEVRLQSFGSPNMRPVGLGCWYGSSSYSIGYTRRSNPGMQASMLHRRPQGESSLRQDCDPRSGHRRPPRLGAWSLRPCGL